MHKLNSLKIKKFTLLHLLLFSLIVSLVTYSLTSFWETKKINEIASKSNSLPVCKVAIKRLSGLKYIKPIMFVDAECESDNLMGIKQRIVDIINRYKTAGDVTSASVYIRKYDANEWVGVNDDEKYQPASLLKVPVLITILKMNEDTPGFLNKIISYDRPFDLQKVLSYKDKSIQLGNKYTVKELLNYMIQYSDNNATVLLESNMKIEIFKKLFVDMGLKEPNSFDKEYLISAKEYSLFMRAIYNAAYLNVNDSEYAAELLTTCDFKDGILKGLPAKTKIAHKFGESGNSMEKQLHESAIVYSGNKPYLLTVMTRGNSNKKLSELIGEISQAVYLDMCNNAANVI